MKLSTTESFQLNEALNTSVTKVLFLLTQEVLKLLRKQRMAFFARSFLKKLKMRANMKRKPLAVIH